MLCESQWQNVKIAVFMQDRGYGNDFQCVINLASVCCGHHIVVRVLNDIREAHLEAGFGRLGWQTKTVEPLQKRIPLTVQEVSPVVWKGMVDSNHGVSVRAVRLLESRVDGDAVVLSAVRQTARVLLDRIARSNR
jgi:hypothetical protein